MRLTLHAEAGCGIAAVVLSRRNLLALLHKLELPGSARTITTEYDCAPGWALSVTSEDDDQHYAGRGAPAGPMHPLTEGAMASTTSSHQAQAARKVKEVAAATSGMGGVSGGDGVSGDVAENEIETVRSRALAVASAGIATALLRDQAPADEDFGLLLMAVVEATALCDQELLGRAAQAAVQLIGYVADGLDFAAEWRGRLWTLEMMADLGGFLAAQKVGPTAHEGQA